MAAEVRWLDQAKDDLREILDYIAVENPRAAERYISELQAACERLVPFPFQVGATMTNSGCSCSAIISFSIFTTRRPVSFL